MPTSLRIASLAALSLLAACPKRAPPQPWIEPARSGPAAPEATRGGAGSGAAEAPARREATGRGDAFTSLAARYGSVPAPQKPAAAQEVARAAEAAGLWAEAARWHAEAARARGGDARELARAAEIVDARLGAAEVAQLRETLPGDSPLLPAVTMKLARAQLQARDDAAALRLAREVAERWPSSSYAADARSMAERLEHRAPVNPRAIGVAVPLSGRLKGWGDAILQGVSLALDGSDLQVVVKDTRGEADGARAALDALATVDGAIAALGGVTNAEAMSAATSAQDGALPFVSLAKVEGVTQPGPFVFRNMLTAEAQAKALAELSARRGLKSFALLYPLIPYGQELAFDFWDEVEARGGEVRAAEGYEQDRTTYGPVVKAMVGKLWLDERQDYTDQVKELAKAEKDPFRRRKAIEKIRDRLPPVVDFDAVFIPDFAKNVALVAPALAVEDVVTQTCDTREVERIRRATGREDLRPVQLLGANGWDDPTLVDRAGKYVECAIFVDGFFPASERPATKAFVTAFTAKYGRAPSILEASAYDSARMVRRVIERGAATRDAVRDSLSALKGYEGATGDLAFDARREVAKRLFHLTVDKGAVRELRPEELASPGAGGS